MKLHADQLSDAGGAALAAEFGALSADHLEYTSDAGVAAMARAGTVAVLLPGAFYVLRETQLPPVAALRAHGVPMAVATDCNPGTSPATSLLLMLNMACTLFRLTPEEALAGVTRHAARALGLADRGTLAAGQRADLALWDIAAPAELGYWIGGNRRAAASCAPARRRALGRPNEAVRARARRRAARRRRSACGNARARAIAARLTPAARAVPDTDWHVEKLFAFARDGGRDAASSRRIRATSSISTATRAAPRSIPAPTTPSSARRARSPTSRSTPTAQRAGSRPRSRRGARDVLRAVPCALAAEIERVRARHGYAILLDGHSIRSRSAALLRGAAAGSQSRHRRRRELRAVRAGCAARVLAGAAGFSRAS